jgi:hypothetical protein
MNIWGLRDTTMTDTIRINPFTYEDESSPVNT